MSYVQQTEESSGNSAAEPSRSSRPSLVIPWTIDPCNPHRPPNWLSECIDFLLKYDPLGHYPWADPWRRRIWQLRHARDTLPISGTIFSEYPWAISVAQQMATAYLDLAENYRGNGSSVAAGTDVKGIIESYTLAGLPEEAIFQRLHPFPPAIISAYLALYFDVADRLQDQHFILDNILCCQPTHSLDFKLPYQFWCEVAYLAGEKCLRSLTDPINIIDNQTITASETYIEVGFTMPSAFSHILHQRQAPDYERTVEDLRNLYRTLEVDPHLAAENNSVGLKEATHPPIQVQPQPVP